MSPSWWFDEVRAGRAPRPVIRGHRCTRWRLADVRRFWELRAAQDLDLDTGNGVVTHAAKASIAAKAKRLQARDAARNTELQVTLKGAIND
jgi:hypothetical protein